MENSPPVRSGRTLARVIAKLASPERLSREWRAYQEFVAERGDDPELRKELSDAYARVGNITAQIGTIDISIAARP